MSQEIFDQVGRMTPAARTAEQPVTSAAASEAIVLSGKPSAATRSASTGMLILVFLLGIYLLAVAFVALAVIGEVYLDKLGLVARFGFSLPQEPSLQVDLRIALLAGMGACLGACLLCFLGLFEHAVLAPEFNPRFFGSYILGPWAVIFLGVSAYVLVRAGLFAFAGMEDVSTLSSANELSYLGLGVLVGFAWNRVLSRFAEIAAQAFASAPRQPAIAVRATAVQTATQAPLAN